MFKSKMEKNPKIKSLDVHKKENQVYIILKSTIIGQFKSFDEIRHP